MAVAAFRSTTKRRDHLSNYEKDGTPFSVTSQKGGHRRTKSFSDPACPYLSDSLSNSGYRTRSYSRHHFTDAESDADGSSGIGCMKYNEVTHPRDRREEPRYMSQLQRKMDKSSGYESASNIGKHKISAKYQNVSLDSQVRTVKNKNRQDFEDVTQMQEIEERTIRPVDAQTKIFEQFQRDPPVEDLDVSSLYEMMRAEVKRAVDDVKKEIHESLEEKRSNSQTSEESLDESTLWPVQSNLIEDAFNVSVNYAAKLQKSKQRARELRLQLEEEERRSTELAKSVCGSLPDSGLVKARRTRRGTDRQMVSRSLDEDARRYFEDCVDILKLENLEAESSFSDGPGTAQNFSTLSKSHALQRSPQEHLRQLNEIDNMLLDKESKALGRRQVTRDGVIMPWLDWESDIDAASTGIDSIQVDEKMLGDLNECSGVSIRSISGDKTVKQNCFSCTRDINVEKSTKTCQQNKAPGESDPSLIYTPLIDNSGTQSLSHGSSMPNSIQPRRHHPRKGLVSMSGKLEHNEEETSMHMHEHILSQKLLFHGRIAQGRMLLCGREL